MTAIQVLSGDIARVHVDALITAINSGGMWAGGIDGVIFRSAGEIFHKQAGKAMPLKDGQTVVARSNGATKSGFKNVVFVVDDLKRPLREVIYAGLKAANDAKYMTVSLPTIRMGVMLGAVEKSVDEAVSEMGEGVRRFLADKPDSIKQITFVVFNDPATQSQLEAKLKFN